MLTLALQPSHSKAYQIKKIEKEFEISKINQKKPFRKVLYRRYIFLEY